MLKFLCSKGIHLSKKCWASSQSTGYFAECTLCGRALVGKQNWYYPEQWRADFVEKEDC